MQHIIKGGKERPTMFRTSTANSKGSGGATAETKSTTNDDKVQGTLSLAAKTKNIQ
jgi:hypothetical protein